uniref:Uncharacterized protein n=1 Tax=Acrobeloides nanus TaxID=290746 RepID=A0A914CKX9_9BILA
MRHLFAVSILFLVLLQLGEARTYRVESFLKRIRNEASDMLLEINAAKEKEYVSKKFHTRIPQEKLNVLEEDMDSDEDELAPLVLEDIVFELRPTNVF